MSPLLMMGRSTLPGIAVAVDEARDQDGIGGIDDSGGGPENFTFAPTATIFLDENVALDEIVYRLSILMIVPPLSNMRRFGFRLTGLPPLRRRRGWTDSGVAARFFCAQAGTVALELNGSSYRTIATHED